MNRRLLIFNLFGVLTLAALCVLQWQHDRRLNLDLNQLENVRHDQELKIFKQEEIARGLTNDLSQLKVEFKMEHDELEEKRTKLRKAENEAVQLEAERDQLKEAVTNWVRAVNERDALIKQANEEIRKLGADLNASIQKFNDLTTNYNSVVKQINEEREKAAAAPKQ